MDGEVDLARRQGPLDLAREQSLPARARIQWLRRPLVALGFDDPNRRLQLGPRPL
jgi:hypothetical protein